MSYCLNSNCVQPENPLNNQFCHSCGAKLLLKGRYRGIKTIGQGGFGRTFLAIDEDIPSKPNCVIKQFFPSLQGSNALQKAKELFAQEAVRLDELGRHKQIPQLLAYFEENGQLYLVQQFINGENLLDELKHQGRFDEFKIKELLNSLLPVLQFVHEQNVIHRDIKPENIIRDSQGKLVLIDFGVSKVLTNTVMSNQGTVVGTNSYAAPEQMRGMVNFSSDLYSLAVTAIRLLTGCFPQEQNGVLVDEIFDVYEMAWCWENWLNKHNISLDPNLINILNKMIAQKVGDRFQTSEEILTQLNQSQPTKPSQTKIQNNPLNVNPTTVKTPPNAPTNQPLNPLLQLELQAIKTEMTNSSNLGQSPPNNTPQKTLNTPIKPLDPIQKELQALKEELSNLNNP
jgi:serine/threonine protein kinase